MFAKHLLRARKILLPDHLLDRRVNRMEPFLDELVPLGQAVFIRCPNLMNRDRDLGDVLGFL
ncbi:MAG: hypothetical protein ACRDGN_02575 [bacterium]